MPSNRARPSRADPFRPGAPVPHLKNERITVRVSSAQRDLLNEASRVQETTLTDFILDAATTRAGDVLADRRLFSLPGEAYQEFLALLDRPVQEKPRLRRLLAEPSIFE